jgi:hypothetical protein
MIFLLVGAVNSISTSSKGMVATGGDDGHVVLWNTAQYMAAEVE